MIIFSLEPTPKPKMVKVLQIALGATCFIIAICWIFINIQKNIFYLSASYPIIFLFLFGFYEIMAGLGHTNKFIAIAENSIKLKQNAIIPPYTLLFSEISKIQIFPLSIEFILNSGKIKRFHFGTSYTEIIVPIKEKIVEIAELNNIPLSFESENI